MIQVWLDGKLWTVSKMIQLAADWKNLHCIIFDTGLIKVTMVWSEKYRTALPFNFPPAGDWGMKKRTEILSFRVRKV